MRGVILAGGTGTRLRPLTHMINKHLLPIGRQPMIYYAVDKLREAGVREILMIIGKQSSQQYMDYFGSGSAHGVRLTYRIQEEAGGIAQAVAQAESFIPPGEKFVVLLGDNLFEESLNDYADAYIKQSSGAKVLLKSVDDPSRYGVPTLEGERIAEIEEKPKQPKSGYSVIGVYFYDTTVFDKIRSIRPSARGELEITDVNNAYAKEGSLTYDILQGWWTDAGTFESLQEAAQRMQGKDRP